MNRQVIIGDIHGCYDELEALLDKVGPSRDDIIISVGDCIDRGPKSLEVVKFLKENDNTFVIAGNHERKHLNKVFNYAQEITKLQFGRYYEETITWMNGLKYFYESNEVIVVHASLIPGLELVKQPNEVLCGSTTGERYLEQVLKGQKWYEVYDKDKPVVFGHYFVGNDPLIYKDKIFGIDTGACHGGYLTAITVPDFKIYSVKAKENYWKLEKRKWQGKVISQRPWEKMKWEHIEKEISNFKHYGEYEVINYINSLELWVNELQGIIPKMVKSIESITNEILEDVGELGFAEVAKKHILSQSLFTCYYGRLNIDVLLKKCISPEKTIELAKVLNIQVPEKPKDLL